MKQVCGHGDDSLRCSLGFSTTGNTGITGAANPTPGMSVCKSGSTTGLTCGTVTRTGLTICYAEGCVNNMAESTAAG